MGNGKKYATYSDFGQSLYNGNFPLNFDSDTTAGEPAENGRKGLVITKNGVFANRDRNLTSAGTLGLVYCGELGDNYEITMDLTPHHISPNDRWNSIVFKFWTGSAIGKDADAGNWFVNWNGGFKDCKLGANKSGTAMGAAESLSVKCGVPVAPTVTPDRESFSFSSRPHSDNSRSFATAPITMTAGDVNSC